MSKLPQGQILWSIDKELGGILKVIRIGKRITPEQIVADFKDRLKFKMTLQTYLAKEEGQVAILSDELIVICLILECSLENIVEVYNHLQETRGRSTESLMQEILDS